jgi:hypothetical protein
VNLTAIIFEQLDWNALLKTLTFKPKDGADLWVARLDEYQDSRPGPFHILEPDQELEFSRQLHRARSRRAGHYKENINGTVRFSTEWRGIPTDRSGLSCYALCLPPDGVPDEIEFSDPHRNGRRYGYHAAYDDQTGRVVCYLECRSKYGSFDFDLTVTLHRDAKACRLFEPVASGREMDDRLEIDDIRELPSWAATSKKDRIIIQQFFDDSKNIRTGDGGVIVNESEALGPTIAGGVSGIVGAIGLQAQGRASSSEKTVLSAEQDATPVGLIDRAKSSTRVKVFGLIMIIAAVAATALLMANVTDIGVAGYALALMSLLVAVIPLFRE